MATELLAGEGGITVNGVSLGPQACDAAKKQLFNFLMKKTWPIDENLEDEAYEREMTQLLAQVLASCEREKMDRAQIFELLCRP